MEQDFPGFVRDLDNTAVIVNGNNFRKIGGYSSTNIVYNVIENMDIML